jgi:hypothetical protein
MYFYYWVLLILLLLKSPNDDKENVETSPDVKEEKPYVKKDKSLVWLKITIGQTFDDALQRYLQRKAERNENCW